MPVPLDPGFFLHRSNRTEQLLEALVDVVATPATDDPLAAECIVVQGQGMGRWLSMSLAAELGVWARPEFPFVRRLLDDCAETVLGAGSGPDVYEGDTLVLAVARELDRFAGDPDFAPVTEYVGDDPGGGRRIQLSERIAQTLDSYTVHRPRLLEQWQRGGGRAPDGSDHRDARWQSKLWRALGEGAECVSPDRRWRALAERLRAEAPPAGALPPRISIFGLSALPPIFVDTFSAIAMHVPVHLFLLTPTREYWADLKSRKAVWREQVASGGALARDEAEVAALEGHPLLASFGRLGRDFQTIFEAQVDYLEDPVERFVDPTEQGVGGADESTVLSRIQARMLRLESPPAGGTARVDPTRDDSIRLHVCHSPLREIEVLHDQLIDLFERDPTLEPKDVVVMSPDIERHAPLVEAVFGVRSALGAGRIPHRIADRSIVVTREGVAAFLRLVEVASGRCGASQVLDVLSLPSVRERYGLDASDVARLEAWVAEAGVRWGLDGEHRAAEGLPDDDTHTWRFGLDRLLLGVAMDPAGDALFEGRRPMRDVEADDLRRVGALSAFVADLEWGHRSLQGQRPLDGWARVFEELVARCIVRRDDNAHHHQALRQSFAALVDCAESAAFEGELSLSAAHSLLLRSLRASTPAYGFLSGGVTFCEMVPMRSIPFRVVCLIGLDDGAFPRVRRPFGFDLAPLLPMVGDRSPRDDDRALFLEAILSARDRLILSYVGRDVHDNEPRPPSVVVSELFDVVEREVGVPPGEKAEGFIVEHPLKSFSRRYFEPDRANGLFSYDAAALAEAVALGAEPRPASPFMPVDVPLAGEAEQIDQLALTELVASIRRASRVALRDRLDIRIDDADAPERDREPSDLHGLPRWQLGDVLLARRLAGEDAGEALYERCDAEGLLPPGELGRVLYDEVASEVDALVELSERDDDPTTIGDAEIDLEVGGLRLVGTLDGVGPTGRVVTRYARLGGSGDLAAWVEHLVMCASGEGGAAPTTRLVGRPEAKGKTRVAHFEPVPDALERLEELVEIALRGREVALPLFAKTSRKYVSTHRSRHRDAESAEEQATLDAYEAYRGRGEGLADDRGESNQEPDIRFLWRDRDPLAPAKGDGVETRFGFRSLANRVFAPMLEAWKEGP